MKGSLGLVLLLLGILLAAGGVSWWGWTQLADVPMGLHGWIALGIGVTATVLLGCGLMFLVFFSARRGYDERVGRD